MSIQVVSRASQAGIGLTVKSIFTRKTIANLALQVGAVIDSNADQGFLTGPAPLLPAVSWFLASQRKHLNNSNHFNQAEFLTLPAGVMNVPEKEMRQILLNLVSHHDALRLSLSTSETESKMQYGTESRIDYQYIVASKLAEREDLSQIFNKAQSSLNLADGHIVAAIHVHHGPSIADQVLLIVHHIAIDGISWRILGEDFQSAVTQKLAGKTISLPQKTLSLRQWASQWQFYIESAEGAASSETWKKSLEQTSASLRSPYAPSDSFTPASLVHNIKAELSAAATQALLTVVCPTFRAQINDVLLACLALAFSRLTKSNVFSFTLEGHGREPTSDAVNMDVSRTVGWFTSIFPVTLHTVSAEEEDVEEQSKSLLETIKKTKEQLRSLPHKGASYGYHRYSSDSNAASEAFSGEKACAEVLFNYLGRFESSFDAVGDLVDPTGTFSRLIDVNALVRSEKMQFEWVMADWALFREDIRAGLAQVPHTVVALLESLVHQVTSNTSEILASVTPHDFAALPESITQAQLDKIVLSSGQNANFIEDIYAMTPLQQGMLFHTLMEPGSEQYVTQLKWTLDARAIDKTRFENAWREVAARHPILRTQFSWEHSDRPLQVVISPQAIQLDWTSAEVENRDQLLSMLTEDRKRGFDLKRASLMRFAWIKIRDSPAASNQVEFIWTHHHMYLDGWSVAIVLNEVLTLYQSQVTNISAASQTLPLPAHYREFVAWMDQQSASDAEKYWRGRLQGILATTPLPNTQSSIPSHLHQKSYFHLASAQLELLQGFVKRHGLTINTVLQTAWALLLSAYSRERKIVFGSTVSGRSGSLRGIESMVGMFINTIPVVIKLDDDSQTLLSILQMIQEDSLDASQFDHSSLASIQTWANLPKGMSLFDSLLVYENYPALEDDSTEAGSRTLSVLDQEAFEKTSMALTVVAGIETTDKKLQQQQLTMQVMYDTGRFTEEAVSFFGGHFVHIITSLISGDVQRKLSEFEMSSAADKELSKKWNKDARSSDWKEPNHCVHDLFELQAYENPNTVALVLDDELITFGTLNTRANQLAHFMLRHCGVQPGQTVSVCAERGFIALVSVLATLKIGSSYIPIDPTYPVSRKSYIMLDSRSALLLTTSDCDFTDPALQASSLPPRIDLDVMWNVITDETLNPDAKKNLKMQVPSGAPIYTIYTSGSTGKPKGVVNTHSNVLSRMDWLYRDGSFTREDRALVRTSLCFDFSTWEHYLPLIYGLTQVLVPTQLEKEVDYLVQLVHTQHVTTMDSIPSMMLGMVLLPDSAQKMGHVRLWMVGGEAIPNSLIKYWYAPDKFVGDVWNVYGPTEATMYTTTYSPARNGPRFSAGAPLDFTDLHIVDRFGHVLPTYMPGELVIGGAGVAVGYNNRPALTASTFVPNPHSQDPRGARLYRSGDLCRHLPSGQVEVVGRIDFQVKVRGFRIELGEVEAAISRVPGVIENVVVTRDISGITTLVAYFAASSDSDANDINPAVLKEKLKVTLPPYMVPTHVVQLPALPLNFNGKVDRNLLPDPIVVKVSSEDVTALADMSPVQAAIADAWKSILRLPHVGLDDNFFELGGDSILSIQIVAKASQAGLKVSVKDIFTNPTVRDLAAHLEARSGGSLKLGSDTAPVNTAEQGIVTGRITPTPVLNWFFRQQLNSRNHFNQAELLELSVPNMARDSMLHLVEKIMSHHDMLRLRVAKSSEQVPELVISDFQAGSYGTILQSVDLTALNGKFHQQKINIADVAARTQRKLDLEVGPIVRFVHFARSEGDFLLVVIHHISVDGISWRTLASDIQLLARAFTDSAGAAAPTAATLSLPPKTTSFKKWSEMLNTHASSAVMASEVQFWRSTLQRAPSRSIRKPGAAKPTYNEVKSITVIIDENDTKTLLGPLCSQYRAQINHVLLLCFAAAFVDSGNFSFTLEGHGREDIIQGADISRTVGWFTSIFPVSLSLDKPLNATTVSHLLKSVKEQLLSIPNKGVGYGILRDLTPGSPVLSGDAELLEKEAIASEISFNYLGQFSGAFASSTSDAEGSSSSQSLSLTGNAVDEHENMLRLIDVNGSVRNGVLQVDWSFAENAVVIDVAAAAERFKALLLLLANHSRTDQFAGGVTPSDFPLVVATQSVTQAQFDELIPSANAAKLIEDLLPLTPMQGGMLFHSLLATADDEYITQMSWTMKKSNVDIATMKQAWTKVIERHAILRTSFVVQGFDQPLQVIHKNAVLDWSEVPLATGVTTTFDKDTRDKVCQADRNRGFKFGFGLRPMRFTLVESGPDEWMLLWTHHHILLDGWSAAIAINEFLTLYASKSQAALGATSSLKPYLSWRHSSSRDPAATKAFWKKHLEGFMLATPLPSSLPPVAGSSLHKADMGNVSLALTTELTQELTDFAKKSNVTLSNVFQAVWAYLLHTYSTETDVVFGNTVAGRSAPVAGLQNVVGLLINTLPLRIHIDRNTSIPDLLTSIKMQQLDMAEFEDTPLVEVQGCSSIAKGLPLFETLFVFENYPVSASPMEALLIEDSAVQERTNFPMSVMVQNNELGQLMINMTYATDRYPKKTAERLANQFRIILSQIKTAKLVRDFSTITPEEMSFLLNDCNNTNAEYPTFKGDRPIVDLFEEQVLRTPDAILYIFGDDQLTFREANNRANQLANYLVKELKVKPEDRIALMLDRGLIFVLSMIACTKAGCCYAPIDPAFPPNRRSNMLEDSGAVLIITEDPNAEKEVGQWAPICYVRPNWSFISHHSQNNLGTVQTSRNMLYMLFTSGSTGRPKGVVIEHRNIINYVEWMKEDMIKLIRKDPTRPKHMDIKFHEHRYLQKTSVCFDISSWELWLPLLEGGACCILPQGGEKDPIGMAQLSLAQAITCLHFVPTVFSVMMDAASDIAAQWDNMRYLVNGGEAAQVKTMAAFQTMHPYVSVSNSYGPTEVTISSHGHEFDINVDKTSVSLGLCISNNQAYILDKNFELVGPGVPGELFVAGVGLARGYHGRFGLTGSRFMPNPYYDPKNPESTMRMYGTGDLCKYLDNGEVDYLRRIDFQVKFRGLRIELGEIEGVLTTHPQVSQALVQIIDFNGIKKLVCHLLTTNTKLNIDELKKLCADSLPSYMVPSYFMLMEKFPVNVSGKLDRGQLPLPVEDQATSEASIVAPRNEVEAEIAAEWESVLKMTRVSVLDNFFELGGDSIVSIQLISRINRRGYAFTVKDIFTHKTIAGMAQVARKSTKTASSGSSSSAASAHGDAPLTPIMHWWMKQNVENRNHFNQADQIQLEGKNLDSEKIRISIASILRHHDALRLRFNPNDRKQVILPPTDANCSAFSFVKVDITEGNAAEIVESAANAAHASLSLVHGPIVAAIHLTSANAQDSLVMIVHHIAIDGVSWRILHEDIPSAVSQALAGKPLAKIELPAKSTSLIAWTSALNTFANDENSKLAKEVDGWLHAIDGARTASLRRSSSSDSSVPTFSEAETLQVVLDSAPTTKLISKFTSTFGAQINDIFVSALAIAIASTINTSRVSLAMEGHGREDELLGLDLSRTVGWFTSIFPVSIRDLFISEPLREMIAGKSASSDTVAAVQSNLISLFKTAKNQLRMGTPNRGFGFGALRYLNNKLAPKFESSERLEDEKAASEILFNYLGKSDGSALGSSSLGSLVDIKDRFNRLIDINAFLRNEKLEFAFTFDKKSLNVDVPALAQSVLRCLSLLSELVDNIEVASQGAKTPSDFPLLAHVLTQAQVDAIATNEVEDLLPLLPMQQGLLYHALLDPADAAYTNQIIYDLPTDTDVSALREAWATLYSRHSILRTGFAWEHGLSQSIQVIHKSAALEWREVTLGALGGEEEEAVRLEEFKKGFDLRIPSLNRFAILKSADASKLKLMWTTHHLYLDGWSLSLIIQELDAIYRGRTDLLNLNMSAPALSTYLDWWSNQDARVATNFWTQTLKGFRTPTPLPGISALSTASQQVDRKFIEFTATETAALVAFARKQHVTLNTLLEAAWGLVLSAHSRETDVVFGATVSGRSTTQVANVESMIGLFINTMPVRVSHSPSEPISDLLHRLQDQHSAALAFEHVPLVQAQLASEVPKGEALFDTIFVFENYPTKNDDESDESLQVGASKDKRKALDLANVMAFEKTNYALSVAVAIDPSTQSLTLSFIFDTGKYPDLKVIQRLLEQFKNAIYNMSLEKNVYVAQIELDDEIVQSNLNMGPVDDTSPDDMSLPFAHNAFVAQAAKTPDAIALVMDDEQVSYASLESRSALLASTLIAAGLSMGQVVAICLPRSVQLVVAVLATLRAGSTYIPIDPAYPSDRQEYLVSDSAAVITIISSSSGLPTSIEHLGTTFDIDSMRITRDEEKSASANFKSPELSPVSFPYLIYTSGTTGKPKGVSMSHIGLATRLAWLRQAVSWTSETVFLQTISSSFDPSAYELLGPISSGSRLVLARHGMQGDAQYLTETIDRFRVTGMTSVPSLLAAFLASSNTTQLRDSQLAHVICGGEALPSHTAATFRSLIPNARLFNAYGPTETCIIATMLDCKEGIPTNDTTDNETVFCSIGSPAGRVYVRVADPSLKNVPAGAIGELLVGGSGISPGYLGRPSLTADKFVPAPYGQRLYRTGDLVRVRPSDDQLEFVGRVDMQVKIRGFRVELGEIEAEIERVHPEVAQAAVVVSRRASSSSSSSAVQLVGFVLFDSSFAEEKARSTLVDILTKLKTALPSHMVPSTLTKLNTLPLTNNGKLDRVVLSGLEQRRAAGDAGAFAPEIYAPVSVSSSASTSSDASSASSASHSGPIAPRNEFEITIAKVWMHVLKLDSMPNIHDSFFELGGDSIVSILVASQATKQGAPLTVRQLTQHRTIAAISNAVFGTPLFASSSSPSSAAVPAKPILPAPQTDLGAAAVPFPLTPIQTWFLKESAIEKKSHWNHSRLIDLPSNISSERVEAAIHTLITHHDALRLQFFLNGDEWQQKFLPCSDALLDGCFETHTAKTAEELTTIMTTIESSFKLGSETSPLFRAALLRLIPNSPTSPSSQYVLFAQHHLITDSLSSRVLLEDFDTLINSESVAGDVLSLKSNSFQQFVQLQLAHAPKVPESEAQYWLDVPVYGSSSASLPVDGSNKPDLSQNRLEFSDTSMFEIGRETTTKMLDLALSMHCSVQDVLMTALYVAIREWRKSQKGKSLNGKSFVIDLESHGREQDMFNDCVVDLSRTIGWFTTVYPFAFGAELASVESPSEILSSVVKSRETVPNNGFAFGLLRQFGSDDIKSKLAKQNPQVLLNYLGEFKSSSETTDTSKSASDSPVPTMGEQRALTGVRQRLLDLNCSIVNGELSIAIEHCTTFHSKATITSFASSMMSVIEQLCSGSAPGASKSVWIHPVDGTTLGLELLTERLSLSSPQSKHKALIPTVSSAKELHKIDSVPQLAQKYAQQLNLAALASNDQKPIVVAGFSFGASVAFEIVKALEATGTKVGALIVLDQPVLPTWTPGDHRRMTCAAVVQFAAKIIQSTLSALRAQALSEEDVNSLHQEGNSESVILPLEPFMQLLTQRQVPEDIAQDLISQIDTYQHLGRIFNTYDWNATKAKISAPITVVRTNDNLEETFSMGWNQFGSVTSDELVASDHYDLLKQPHVDRVAALLKPTFSS